jgi:hypothetical protein
METGKGRLQRSWVWEPAEGKVTFAAPEGGRTVTYRRDGLAEAGEDIQRMDAWFVHDERWLLFPLHLDWDRQAAVEDKGVAPLPMGTGSARRLVVRYPEGGGPAAGDVYELFIGEDRRLMQWIWRRGGASEPPRVAAWESHRPVGPLVIALVRRGPEESFRIWFTDVRLRLRDAREWIAFH